MILNKLAMRGMGKLLLLSHFLIFSLSQSLYAQELFTDRLQRAVEGQGVVRLHQDTEIVMLVCGRRLPSTASSATQANRSVHTSDSLSLLALDTLPLSSGRKVRMNGYRVQVYLGGNSRDAKYRAYQVEGQVKSLFPGQPVYTRFVSPRWICHVGDFQTREEALELLEEMKKTGRFPEAIMVKCKINAFVYE